jgi:hypothetical protein
MTTKLVDDFFLADEIRARAAAMTDDEVRARRAIAIADRIDAARTHEEVERIWLEWVAFYFRYKYFKRHED